MHWKPIEVSWNNFKWLTKTLFRLSRVKVLRHAMTDLSFLHYILINIMNRITTVHLIIIYFWKPVIVILNAFSLMDWEELNSFESYWHRFHFWNAPKPEQIIQFCVPNPCPHFLHTVHSHYPLIFILKWKMIEFQFIASYKKFTLLEIYFNLTIIFTSSHILSQKYVK